MSDSFRFDITDDTGLEEILAIAFRKNQRGASGWRAVDGTLVFYWGDVQPPIVPFPTRIDHKAAAEVATAWLAEQDYGRGPDTDGSAKRGFRVYNDRYGHAGGTWQGFVTIKPEWTIYGK
jgi:hypothetical protein